MKLIFKNFQNSFSCIFIGPVEKYSVVNMVDTDHVVLINIQTFCKQHFWAQATPKQMFPTKPRIRFFTIIIYLLYNSLW